MADFNLFTDEVFDAIRAHIEANWDLAACPVSWPNEEMNEPQGPWVKFEISGNSYGQQSIGMGEQAENRWDEDGLIWFHVMVPRGRGFSQGRGAAKALADLFRGRRLLDDENLEFLDASIGPGGDGDEEGNWYRVSVSIEWRNWEA
jgi:hypothetical protein